MQWRWQPKECTTYNILEKNTFANIIVFNCITFSCSNDAICSLEIREVSPQKGQETCSNYILETSYPGPHGGSCDSKFAPSRNRVLPGRPGLPLLGEGHLQNPSQEKFYGRPK